MGFRGLLCGMALAVPAMQMAQAQQGTALLLPEIDVTASRLSGTGITGASTTIITAEQIADAPESSLQDIIARAPGVQTWSTAGGINGAGTTVDLRGFGATAPSNTLVLINGRRLTDVDLAGVDFSSIPRASIQRIEITRGNSGAVLYGDGAVGGVINIVTKTGVGLPPSVHLEGALGSFAQREGTVSANTSSGPFSASAFATSIDSNGYRENSALRQRDGVADLHYTGKEGTAYVNISADDQKLGLPGARRVDPTTGTNELVTDRIGATTPTAFAKKQGLNVTAGVTRTVSNDVELIVDGGVRDKKQQAFSSLFGFDTSDARELTTVSITPRAILTPALFGLPSKIITGLDFYNSSFFADRGAQLSDPPIHHYDLTQRSLGLYWQHTIAVTPRTDVSYGARLQNTTLSASDRFDPTAPGAFLGFDAEGVPLHTNEWQHALHFGVEHRFTAKFAVFGRVARSFRTPNVDERVGVNAFPVNFDLATQTSRDLEAGFRVNAGAFEWQTSAYDMRLNNELLFIPFPPIGANINLDPTHRYGVENAASYRVFENLRLNGSVTYTRAVFREGPFAGNDVPLVSRWTGSAGVTWDILPQLLVFDAVIRYVGDRRMDNDQANFQPLIPAHTVVDVRLGGKVDRFNWSVAVQNLFDEQYFDYAVASASTFGIYNAYPQPGRTFIVRAGATF